MKTIRVLSRHNTTHNTKLKKHSKRDDNKVKIIVLKRNTTIRVYIHNSIGKSVSLQN